MTVFQYSFLIREGLKVWQTGSTVCDSMTCCILYNIVCTADVIWETLTVIQNLLSSNVSFMALNIRLYRTVILILLLDF
jgi:hypothetical protein